ncbi:hypothetical protein F3X89_17385 [Rhizobium rhizogenes]|uniref:hypothetical protein n=1 Tax=Rhizobium rhizogenes TaxID=359 RepID=UPI00193CCB73|nr:hypothetical protein [Rhizobium rhizogenes]QRM39467.1 hypothetical protein F3X89_17385 [Rhizobium rhizogenes]
MVGEYPNIQKIMPYLQSGEKIPHRLMLYALNESTDTLFTEGRRAAANAILEGAGDYLGAYYLMDFISAKTDQEVVERDIQERSKYVARLQELFPAIVDLLGLNDPSGVSSTLHQITDCCHDYPLIETSDFSTTQRKAVLRDLDLLVERVRELNDLLEVVGKHVDIEFRHHKEAVHRMTRSNVYPARNLHSFQGDLRILGFVTELVKYHDETGGPAFYVGGNKARTHIVEYAYRLAIQFDSPKFVTTPGSDFSILCSLIFELATGLSDESLAGAINKFARSKLRDEIDRDEVATRYENSDEGMRDWEADNFAHVKDKIAALSISEKFWRQMDSSRNWDEFSKGQMAIRLVDVLEQKEDALKQHGPHIVWASQISLVTREAQMKEMEEFEAESLKLAIKVGRMVRGK